MQAVHAVSALNIIDGSGDGKVIQKNEEEGMAEEQAANFNVCRNLIIQFGSSDINFII